LLTVRRSTEDDGAQTKNSTSSVRTKHKTPTGREFKKSFGAIPNIIYDNLYPLAHAVSSAFLCARHASGRFFFSESVKVERFD
jgi:hypothetical protein